MSEAEEWRARARAWRLLVESGDDAILHSSLLTLADEAEAVAAEIESDARDYRDSEE